MEKNCPSCLHCRRIPLETADADAGVEPLLRCRKGRFDLREAYRLPAWRPDRMCPDYEGEADDGTDAAPLPRPGRENAPVLNLAAVLPPELLAEVRRAVKGPRLVYVPVERVPNEAHERILETYAQTGSIRGTAERLGCGRNTVRRVIRRPENGPRLARLGAETAAVRADYPGFADMES